MTFICTYCSFAKPRSDMFDVKPENDKRNRVTVCKSCKEYLWVLSDLEKAGIEAF